MLDKVWVSLYTGRIGQGSEDITSRTMNHSIQVAGHLSVIRFTWVTAEMTIIFSGRDFPLEMFPWAFPHTACEYESLISPEQPRSSSLRGGCPAWQGHIWGVGRRRPRRGLGVVPGHREEGYVSSQLPFTTGERRQRHSCPKYLLKGSWQ